MRRVDPSFHNGRIAMTAKRRRGSRSAVAKSMELAFAVPQVVAHRTQRALAGSQASLANQREFSRMISEKQAAFSQAWFAMAIETFRVNQSIAASMLGSFMFPGTGSQASTARLRRKMQAGANSIINRGLAPVHRTAVANAKRLGRAGKR